MTPDAVRAAAARIPNGEFELVPSAGHWLPRDAPDVVADRLLDLVAAVDQPTSFPSSPSEACAPSRPSEVITS